MDSGPLAVVTPWQRLVLALVIAASLMAISIAMYFMNGRIAGIQGRYFLPLALAAAWIFHTGRQPRFKDKSWVLPAGVALLTVVSFAVTACTICDRYYG